MAEESIKPDTLAPAFDNTEEADAAFVMFDKDLNGDIEMSEFENVCVEIGRERKAITASLKDLDSVVSKLDDCFTFIVVVIAVLVLISLLSTAAAGVLTSAGSVVLALSWLFQATAQEFLQSVIFVFVKHPFDVGDRVTVYGNTGTSLQGDDYFVKEISLLYTEFKKMEGHVVQAPNSYLNTLFILNQRRSGGIAEAVPITFKYGTTLEQIDGLRSRLEAFVREEKREYQSRILTELRDVCEAHSITLNIVFFYKSSWQNEGLRLQRRNKFFCALMVSMQELGIEGPRMRYPGQKESFPVYLQQMPFAAEHKGRGGTPDNPGGLMPIEEGQEPSETSSSHEPRTPIIDTSGRAPTRYGRSQSIANRRRGESLAQTARRMDFSLGMEAISSGDASGDVYDDRESKIPKIITMRSPSRPSHSAERRPSRGVAQARPSEDALHTVTRASTYAGPMGQNSMHGRLSTSSIHRNRFFGRRSQDGADRALESGMMRGIPEGPGSPREEISSQRLDPRTGLVSPGAVRLSNDESPFRRVSTKDTWGSSIGTETTFQSQPIPRPPPRSATTNQQDRNIEMSRFV